MSLNQYIEGLVKEAQQRAQESSLSELPLGDLAKLAGIKLSAHSCPKCGQGLVKVGAVNRCQACGLVKRATEKTALVPLGAGIQAMTAPLAGSIARMTGRGVAAGRGAVQTAAQKAAPMLTGSGGGALSAKELAAGQGPVQRLMGQVGQGVSNLKGKLVGAPPLKTVTAAAAIKEAPQKELKGRLESITGEQHAAQLKLPQARAWRDKAEMDDLVGGFDVAKDTDIFLTALKGRLESITGEQHAAQLKLPQAGAPEGGVGKTAGFWSDNNAQAAREVARLKSVMKPGMSGPEIAAAYNKKFKKTASFQKEALPLTGAIGAVGGVLKKLPGMIAGKAKQVGQTFQQARGAAGGQMALPGMAPKRGLMGAAWETAKAHPGVAMGAAAPVAYGMGKMSSDNGAMLLQVADAAGRMLAKMAAGELAGVPREELEESIEEAKGREDIPGRSRSWQIGGGVGGGLAGGALGFGAGKLLGRGNPLSGLLGGLGAAGGGYLGQRFGGQHGEEEAKADVLLEQLRGQQAYGHGGQQGFQAGYQAGLIDALQGGGEGQNPQ